MLLPIIRLGISSEQDLVVLRQRARQISASLGFGAQDQVRIATAVSEVSRIAFVYTSGGSVEFSVDGYPGSMALSIGIASAGGELRGAGTAGPANTDPRNAGRPTDTGLEAALVSAHRLMDRCSVEKSGGFATLVTLVKSLPAATTVTTEDIAGLVRQLSASPELNTFAEVELQNRELLDTLAELRVKQDALLALTQELEDTNRGVVALYAEIEEKAERLRQADEMKSRFLSNTSHELRTPLSSIRALSKLLLDRIDGDLTVEQEKQIRFIERAAFDLSELVNDLLDLAKIEAGKIDLQRSTFAVSELFSSMRGMLRPIAINPAVELVFDDPDVAMTLDSDEGKVSQIVRNFVSNALKFTEQGVVRVTAASDTSEGTICIAVTDSGIGIAPENQKFVFEEFSQIENPLQRRFKGTGLGLPLCRKLAHLLGGEVRLVSTPGAGSEFSLILPLRSGAASRNTQKEPA